MRSSASPSAPLLSKGVIVSISNSVKRKVLILSLLKSDLFCHWNDGSLGIKSITYREQFWQFLKMIAVRLLTHLNFIQNDMVSSGESSRGLQEDAPAGG